MAQDNPVFAYAAPWRRAMSAMQWLLILAGAAGMALAEPTAWAVRWLAGDWRLSALSVRLAGAALLAAGIILGVAWRRVIRYLFRRRPPGQP